MRKFIIAFFVIALFVILSLDQIKKSRDIVAPKTIIKTQVNTEFVTIPKVKYLTSTKIITNNEPTEFLVTGYTAGPESTGKSPGHPEYGITYTGTKVRMPTAATPGTCAVDPNVIPFGTILFVEGYGICRAEDKGSAVQGYHIDAYVKTVDQAFEWISNHERNVWILNEWSD